MSDENKATAVLESPASTTPASTTEPQGGTAAPIPNQTTTTGTSGNATVTLDPKSPATAAAQEVPDDYEWDGDQANLPKPLQNRAKGVLRYLTKQTQGLAEEKKLAEEYRKLQQNPAFSQFIQAQQSPNQIAPPPQQMAPSLYTREELEEAQVNPEKLGSLIERVASAKVQVAEEQAGRLLSEIKTKQTFIDRKQELQDFAELNPDFWDLHAKGLIKPYIREIVDTGQGTLQDAYNKAKEVREQFRREALLATQPRILEKKAAFTSPPTPSNEPEIVWANDKNEATRLAFENALQGKKVQVKVKK